MQSAQNLQQALEQMKREMQKEMTDLATKEAALRTNDSEKITLQNKIREDETVFKQKEIELQKFKVEIQQAKNKIPILEQQHRKLAEEVTRIRLEHGKKNMELTKIQRDYADAVKIMGKQ